MIYNQSNERLFSSSFSSTIMPIRPSLSLFNVYKRTFSLWHIILIDNGVDLVWSVNSAPQHFTQHFVPTPKKSCRVSIPQLTDVFCQRMLGTRPSHKRWRCGITSFKRFWMLIRLGSTVLQISPFSPGYTIQKPPISTSPWKMHWPIWILHTW